MTHEEFETLVSEAIDAIPEPYSSKLSNVAFVIEDDPNPEQRRKLKLRCDTLLFGLYEGIPQTARRSNYSGVLPDKITIFKNPILAVTGGNPERIKKQVHRTVWHEVAHHYGLDHDDIHRKESEALGQS